MPDDDLDETETVYDDLDVIGPRDGYEWIDRRCCPTCWPTVQVIPPTPDEPRYWRLVTRHARDCATRRTAPAQQLVLDLDLDRQETRP